MARRKTSEDKQLEKEVDKLEKIRTSISGKHEIEHPLTHEHLARLNEVIRQCEYTKELCEKCIECGIDVEPELKLNNEQLEVAKKIKSIFFPDER